MKKIIALLLAVIMICSLTSVVFAGADNATLFCSASSKQLSPGDELTVTVSLQNAPSAKSIALVFDYDVTDTFTLVDGEWTLSGALLANFDGKTTACGTAAIAYMAAANINGNIFELKLKVKESAPIGEKTITVSPVIKYDATIIPCDAAFESVTIKSNAVCAHTNKTAIAEKASTAEERGWDAYYQCSNCGQLFAQDGVTELSEIPYRPLLTAFGAVMSFDTAVSVLHPGDDVEITVSLQNALSAKSIALVFDYDVTDTFTLVSGEWLLSGALLADFDSKTTACGTAAIAYMSAANINGNIFKLKLKVKETAPLGETTLAVSPVIKNDATSIDCHSASITLTISEALCPHTNKVHVSAKESTCQEQGWDEYYYCSDCNQIFAADGETEIDELPFRSLLGHTGGEATCKSTAVCTVCGRYYGDLNSDNHKGTTYLKDQKEATCYEEGYTGDTYCSDCNTKLSSGTVIEKDAHNPASVWSTDENYHWKDCQTIGCGNIIDKAAHTGGEATCTKKAICSVCSVEYGIVNAENHRNTELRNVKSATEEETGYTGDLYCKDCQKVIESGTVVPKLDHIHNMMAVSAKSATCTAEGNTAYWYCSKCGKYYSDAEGKIEIDFADTIIAKLDHSYTVFRHDNENHWYKCENCDSVTAAETHAGGNATCINKATCSVCGTEYGDFANHTYVEKASVQYLKSAATCNSKAVYYKTCSVCEEKSNDTFEYGEFDSSNHIGGTYIKDQKEATCYHEGYTGDTYCSDCNAKIASGTVIGKNEHTPASVWSTDADYHWKDCQTVGCGNIIDKAAHTGGEATCTKKAICSVCGVEYGMVSADNHVNTEIRNDKVATEDEAGYTGDTYCNDCKKVIKIGTTIPKLDHTHSMTAVAQKDATCTANGNIAYWHCTKCDKYYSDADGKTEIALADTVIEQLEHNYSVLQKNDNSHWYKCADCDAVTTSEAHAGGTATCAEKAVCSVCGTAYGALLSHTYVEKADAQYLKSAATCNSKAVYYKSCSVCGKKSEEVFESGEFDADNHAGVATYIKDQKEASCYEEGYTGDTYCSGCNTKLSSGTVIGKNEHNPASVWSTDAEYHWKDCQTIGCGNIIDKAVHSGGIATCTKKAICEVCGVEYGSVNADNHGETEIRNAVDATCTIDGYTGDTYCKDCGTKTADGTVIPAAHKLNKIDAKAATHEADGNIEYYKCSGCDKLFKDADAAIEITLEDTVIAKGEHDYGDTYKADAENHWKECGCGNIIEKSAHAFGDWSVTKDATATENGTKERTCSVCGYKATEVIPAMGTATDPTEPTSPAKPNKPSDTTEKSPQTGDTSNMTLWIALMFISAVGVGTMTALNRKKRVK